MTADPKTVRQDDDTNVPLEGDVRCLDDEEVLAFLDRRLGGARLRAAERHLDGCDACRRLVGYVAREEVQLSATLRSVDTGLDAGAMVDHFRVEGRIGVGGMGEIYLATDTELLRPVAIKLISKKLVASAEARDRLVVEARATARIRHPGVVQIYSAGVHAGRPYLALEHVEGETLKAYLDRGRPKLFEILDFGAELAEAVSAAHAEGVLHRDLKPHNAIIARDGRLRVLDFGLAKVLPPVAKEDDDLSQWRDVTSADPKSVRGTPGYMSPEQWKNEDVTPAADVWGIGVILYEMISGDRPYRESSAISYAVRVCDAEPVPPIPSDAGVPEALRELVARCLDKSPGARPSAMEVAKALRAIAGEDSVRLARELDRAAQQWTSTGTPADTLWEGRVLAEAERVLLAEPFSMDPRTTRFLSASIQKNDRRLAKERRRLAAAGVAALAFGVLASVFGFSSVKQTRIAEEQRDAAEHARAQALVESAAAAWTNDARLEARAKLRSAFELADSTLARVLSWRVGTGAEIWSHRMGAGAYDVAVSPDASRVVVASQDGTVHVVDAETLETENLRGLGDQVLELDVSADGTLVAAASRSGHVALWDLARGTRRELAADIRLDALAFTPGGDALVGGNRRGEIHVFDLSSSDPPARWASEHGVFDLVATADGDIVTAEADGALRRYDLAARRTKSTYGPPTRSPALSVSVRGERLAAGDAEGRVRLWTAAGDLELDVVASPQAIQRVLLTRGRLFAAGTDRNVYAWSDDASERRSLTTHEGGVWGLARFDDETIVTASLDGVVRRLRVDRTAALATRGGHTDGATSIAFSPDGTRVLSGGYDRVLREWDAQTGRLLAEHRGHEGTIYDVAAADGRIATASHDRTARLWKDGVSKPLLLHTAGVYAIAFGPGGAQLFTASADGTARAWDAETSLPLETYEGHAGPVYAVAVSPGGRIATGGGDAMVRVFGTRPMVLEGHEGPVWSVAFGAEDLFSGSYDGTVRRWSLATGEGRVVGRAGGRIYSVDVFDDRVAVGAADRGVYVFAADGARKTFEGHRSEVNAVRFDPTGRRLASASDDGTVRVWDVETGAPLWRPAREGAVCSATWDGRVERWPTGAESPAFSVMWPGVDRAVPHGSACLALGPNGELRLYEGRGEHRTLAPRAGPIASGGAEVLALIDGEVRTIGSDGATKPRALDADLDGVTALALVERSVALGYDNGRIELEKVVFEGTPSSPVTRLDAGPRDTVAAGFADGTFGLWHRETGALLFAGRLHGAIVRLSVTEDGLSATSELGDHGEGPQGLAAPYCEALERLWREVPVVWSDGRARRASARSQVCKSG